MYTVGTSLSSVRSEASNVPDNAFSARTDITGFGDVSLYTVTKRDSSLRKWSIVILSFDALLFNQSSFISKKNCGAKNSSRFETEAKSVDSSFESANVDPVAIRCLAVNPIHASFIAASGIESFEKSHSRLFVPAKPLN